MNQALNRIRTLLAIAILTIFTQCQKSSNCSLTPETGNCEAAIPRYYFDSSTKECKQFIWGGCDGVVPFETIEACRSQCK
jgi:hypothetical protein